MLRFIARRGHSASSANVVAILPRDHHLASSRDPISLAELAGEPFVFWSRANAPNPFDAAIAMFRDRGLLVRDGVGFKSHFATREELLDHLTHRSFEMVLANAKAAAVDGETGRDALRRFIEAAITQRNQFVLPLHGGPPVTAPATVSVRERVHQAIRRLIARGHLDGTINRRVTARDIVVVFGAMLAQPRERDPAWDVTCRRLLATYLAGLAGLAQSSAEQ